MRPNHTDFTSRASVAIVRVACVAAVLTAWSDRAFAQAGDNGPKPASTVEVGLGGVTDGSFKAGEYNGLQNKGVFGVANVDLRGGGAYDSDNAMRWRVRGTNLGLETRSLAAEVGIQGRYRATFLYDELLHNRSDTYQTPLLGAGTNTLTLPGSWLVPNVPSSAAGNNRGNTNSARGLVPSIGHASYIDTQTGSPTIGQVIAPNAAQLAKVDAALVADLPLFANVDLSTKRTKYGAGLGYDFTPAVVAKVSFVGEHKDGLQPLGTVSRNTGGDISTIIPLKIDSDTNQVDSSVAYKSDRGLLQAGYYASLYSNNVGSMSWQNWATGANATGAGTTNTISTAPSNTLHQFNFSGRYNFSKATRLVAHGSYGRNSQNDTFITNATTPVVPESSLNGLVVYSAFSAKLTNRPSKKLNLTAQYKFDDRDDKTSVMIFQYADAEEAASPNTNFPAGPNNPLGAVVAQNANANRPYSRKLNLVGGEAEYALQGHQWVKGGYDYQRTDYWCNGSWIDCAVAAKVNSNTVRAEWRANVSETLNARVNYAFDMRRTPGYNENSFLSMVPYANVVPATATGGQSAYAFMVANGWNGYGPTLGFAATTGNMNLYFPSNNALANTLYGNGNRISELQGMRRYFVSDRDRQKLRSSADWQAREALSFEGSVDFTGDTYTDATYGLQEARAWASNVDATYTIEDGLSATAFYTYEHLSSTSAGNSYTANSNTANVNGFTALSGNSGCDSYTTLQQRNNNNKIDPCLEWSSAMRDRVHTIGFTLDKKAAKLDLSGSLLFSSARSDNTMTGGSWANNPLALPGAPAGTIAAYFIPATSLPTVPTDTSELRLNGKYTVDSHQLLRVFYSFMHMKSSDWAYDGMQTGLGTIAGVLPTNEQAFNYNVNIIGASYIVTF